MTEPEHIHRCLREAEGVLLATHADLTKDGTFGRRWLVVTNQRLMTFRDEDGAPGPEIDFSLSGIDEVRPVHHVGKMSLEVLSGNVRNELISCTTSRVTHLVSGPRDHEGLQGGQRAGIRARGG